MPIRMDVDDAHRPERPPRELVAAFGDIVSGLAMGVGDRPLTTVDVFAALARTDRDTGWDTVQECTAYLTPADSDRFPDRAPRDGESNGRPITGDVVQAIATAEKLAEAHELLPVPPGLLAIGLVWDPHTGAARALLAASELSHRDLIRLLERELLDTALEGLLDKLPESRSAKRARKEPGPFTDTRAIAPVIEPRAAPLNGSATLPASLRARLAGAETLRVRQVDEDPWVLAKGERVFKVTTLPPTSAAERLTAELQVGLALRGLPDVVAPESVTVVDGRLVIEEPRLRASLADHIARTERGEERRLSAEAYAAAFDRAAQALHRLHERGIVHGHLKPTNLLIDPATGWLAVSDPVGPSRDHAARGTWTHRILGPDRSIAPEQHLGERGPSVDQYSLAVSAHAVLGARGAAPLTAPVKEVLERGTAVRPEDRFDSVREFGASLKRAVAEEAPRGAADALAALSPAGRLAVAPALTAAFYGVLVSAVDARDQPSGAGMAFLATALGIFLGLGLTSYAVRIAAAIRGARTFLQLRWARLRGAAPMFTVIAAVALWFGSDGEDPWTVLIFAPLLGYGFRGLAAPVAPGMSGPLDALARAWDRRRILAPPVRWLVTGFVVLALVAFALAPTLICLAPRDAMLAGPVRQFSSLATVWEFRAALDAQEFDRVCDQLVVPGTQWDAPCADVARLAALVQAADRLEEMPGLGRTLDTFRVQEVAAPEGSREYQVLTPAGRQTGRMYTSDGRVVVTLARSSAPLSRSAWTYVLEWQSDRWGIAAFRACRLSETSPTCDVRHSMELDELAGALEAAQG